APSGPSRSTLSGSPRFPPLRAPLLVPSPARCAARRGHAATLSNVRSWKVFSGGAARGQRDHLERPHHQPEFVPSLDRGFRWRLPRFLAPVPILTPGGGKTYIGLENLEKKPLTQSTIGLSFPFTSRKEHSFRRAHCQAFGERSQSGGCSI